MESVCPLCNGLTEITSLCPRCGSLMKDQGALEVFYGPYSPYQGLETIRKRARPPEGGPGQCVHLLSCPGCGEDTRISVSRIPL